MSQYLNTVGDDRRSITTINFLASEIFFPLLRRWFCLCNLISFIFFFKYKIRYYCLIKKKKKKICLAIKAIFLTVEAHERHLKHDSNKEQGTIRQRHLVIGEA